MPCVIRPPTAPAAKARSCVTAKAGKFSSAAESLGVEPKIETMNFGHSRVQILPPQPATLVSVTRFPGVAEVPTFQRVRLVRASLLAPV